MTYKGYGKHDTLADYLAANIFDKKNEKIKSEFSGNGETAE